MESTKQQEVMPPGTPGTPLQPISQSRMNTIQIPQSPSPFDTDSRRGSEIGIAADVRSKIAFFSAQNHAMSTNSFAIAGSPTRSPLKSAPGSPFKHSRASSVVSIPTNPSDITALVQSLSNQLEQSRSRERLVAERVESMMEQLQSSHSRARQEQNYSEKELKSMKKQVHKAELALIRSQAELEETRREQEGFKMRAEHERQAKEKSRQEAFERARTLASNIEELEVIKRERDMLISENESLLSIQKSIELAVPKAKPQMREASVQTKLQEEKVKSPMRTMTTCLKCEQISEVLSSTHEATVIEELKDEMDWLKSQLQREKDLVHFMNMQCQFRACPCRMAEMSGVRFVHDHAYDIKQQETAKAKGIKRKAQDELPLPRYVTLRESFEQKSRERQDSQTQSQRSNIIESESLFDQPLEYEPEEVDEEPTLRAMPNSGSSSQDNTVGVISLEEAVIIPLPSPRSDDPEPTSLLEEMTQVMIEPEPMATADHFSFSTSRSSRPPVQLETPDFRKSYSAMSVNATDDLFDIRPPKSLPPRPSTVMGVRTIASPIRMVPASPNVTISLTSNTSPPRTITRQIPLKDSPLKNAVTQRRSQSRPRSRAQSRVRSPTPAQLTNPDSPAAETYFPVTPKQKSERPIRNIQTHSQATLQSFSQSTTTTRVPVRGYDEDDMFSPEKQNHTQPIHNRGRQPLSETDPNTFSQSQGVLPGTPITREAALAQIRARRDRARSVAMKKAGEDENDNRGAKTPKSIAKRGVLVGMGRDISNLSQASAPARFGAGF